MRLRFVAAPSPFVMLNEVKHLRLAAKAPVASGPRTGRWEDPSLPLRMTRSQHLPTKISRTHETLSASLSERPARAHFAGRFSCVPLRLCVSASPRALVLIAAEGRLSAFIPAPLRFRLLCVLGVLCGKASLAVSFT